MTREVSAEIYMVKKSAQGVIAAFRLGTRHGLKPGTTLNVLNEDGIPVGSVQVVSSSELESEALAGGESGVTLGCRVSLPQGDHD